MNPQFLIEILVKARRELGDVMQKAAAEVDKLTQAEARRADVEKRSAASSRVAQKSVQDLTKGYDEYTKKLKAGVVDNEVAIKQLERFSKEFEALAKKVGPAGSSASESLLKISRDAKNAAAEIDSSMKMAAKQAEQAVKLARDEVERAKKVEVDRVTAIQKSADDQKKIRDKQEIDDKKRIDREVEAAYRESAEIDKAYEQLEQQRAASSKRTRDDERAKALDTRRFWAEVYTAMAEDQKRSRDSVTNDIDKSEAADRQRLIDTRIKGEEELSKTTAARANAQQVASNNAAAALAKEVQSHKDLREEIDRSVRAYDDFARSVRQGDVVGQDARVGLTQHAQALRGRATQATRAFGAGSPEALVPGIRGNEASDLIKNIGQESERATSRVGGLTGAFQKLFHIDSSRVDEVDKLLESISGRLEAASYNAVHFAGTLRALVPIGVIVFFSQLVSGAIALAGALTAVASAAITAGAAIGGALAAGVAQALPVFGLLAAAWGRVGAVFKAVQQNIKDQATAGYDAAQSAQKQVDAALALTEAQEALNVARREAVRQVDDLVAAERRAQLQAESAALAQQDSQKALAQAVRSGDLSQAASLSLQARTASFDNLQAGVGAARATVDARRAVAAGPDGQPNVVAASRALQQAKRDAADAADQTTTAGRSLQQMLADLSPAERQLYEVLNRVVKRYRAVFTGPGGVIESITEAFTFGAKRVLVLLDDDRIVSAARRLSEAISIELKRAFSALSGQDSRNFIVEIADQARRNLPTITDFALQVLKIAEALAKAGGPALSRFLDFFATLATKGAAATSSNSGIARLTAFFDKGEQYAEDIVDLTGALLDLFGAIVGASAKSGDDLIKSITGSIRQATDWIHDHKREVAQFFTDAISASKSIASALESLARGLFGLFNSDQVTTFSRALTRTFLPALNQVFTVLGLVADAFLKFAGTGPGSAIGQFLIVSIGLNKTLVPLVRLFGQLGLNVGKISQNKAIVGFFGTLLTKLGPVGIAASVVAAGLLLINSRTHFVGKFSDLFVSAQERSRQAAERFTDSINKQIEALRKQKETGDSLQASRLSRARAEIAVERAQSDAKKAGGIDLSTGRIDSGVKATVSRRDASIALKQALLDEKQARDDVKSAKKADNDQDQVAVTTSKQTLDNARSRINALQDERKQLTSNRDEAKRNVQAELDTSHDQTKSLEQRQHATVQLKEDLPKLQDAQDALSQNTKDLRAEANRSVDAFNNYRKAVKSAGKSTNTFANIVDDTIDGIVNDVNTVLVEFGAKPLKWTSKRKSTKVEDESGSDAIFGTPSIGGFPGHQEGGTVVPGYGTGDKVPMQAMVEPGEKVFVLNRMASKAMDGLRWLNKAVPRFAKGGEIDWNGHPSNVNQPVISLIKKVQSKWPGMVVSDTTDHALRTTSGNISDHVSGNAVDMSASIPYMFKVAEWIKSSGLYHSLKQGIHNPNLAVNAGQIQAPPGQFAGAVWGQHINHIHLAITGAIGKLIGGITSVAGRTITGPAGRLTDALRGISSRVVRAANSFIKKQTSSSTSDEDFAGLPTDGADGNGASLMKSISKQFGWNFSDWWALDASETGHGANEVNPTSTARLRAQFLRENWGKYGPGSDPSQNPSMAQQIQSMARYIKERYGNPTKAWAFHMANNFYAKGGQVAGRIGQAVPIVAHAGEWVVNQIQQSKLAQMMGTGVDHLRGALGFTGGPSSYAGGGQVSPYSIPASIGTDSGDVQRELGRANKVINGLKSSLIGSKFTDALSKTFEAIAGDGGLLDLLTQSLTDLTTKLDTNLRRATFKVTKTGLVIKRLSDEDVANKTVENLEQVYGALNTQQVDVQHQLDGVVKRLRSDKLSSGERTYLLGVQKNLTDRLTTIRGSVADNLQSQFDAVENVITALTNKAQDEATTRSAVLDLQARARIISGSTGSALLGLPSPEQIAQSRAVVLSAQADAIRTAAIRAEHAGHEDTADALIAQIADLREQAIEVVAQGLRDAEADIDARGTRQSTAIALSGRVADLKERLGDTAGAFALRGTNLQSNQTNILSQIGDLTALLGRAQAAGQGGVADELVDKIAELNQQLAENTASIAENTIAARTAAINAITARQGFLGGVFSGVTGIVNSLGEASGVTDTGTLKTILQKSGTTLGQTQSGLLQKLFEGFGIDLRGQSPGQLVQSLLGINFDSAESGLTPTAKSQFEDLINSIIGNTTATVDNTKQLDDLNSPTAQSFTSGLWDTFRRAVFNGAGGLLPQFATSVPSLAGPGFVMSGGFTSASTRSAAATAYRGTTPGGDTTINSYITTPTVVHDPVDEARQLAFAYKNRTQR